MGLFESEIRINGIPKFPKKANEGSSGLTTDEKNVGKLFEIPSDATPLDSISACFTLAIAFRAISRSNGEEYTFSV